MFGGSGSRVQAIWTNTSPPQHVCFLTFGMYENPLLRVAQGRSVCDKTLMDALLCMKRFGMLLGSGTRKMEVEWRERREETRRGKIRKCEGRGVERNKNGRRTWPFPSTRCRPASHANLCCRFGSFSGEFAFAKHALPNVCLLEGLD